MVPVFDFEFYSRFGWFLRFYFFSKFQRFLIAICRREFTSCESLATVGRSRSGKGQRAEAMFVQARLPGLPTR